MKKRILIILSLLSFAYQYSFFNTYWLKDELVNFNPLVADIYWITAGSFGIGIGLYAFIKYKTNDLAYFFSSLTLLIGLPILGLFVLASFITSM
ncbi:hypothetical protein [Priestia megaterium]|jgi:hypothetical protein|uniref:hypothetical protein n=1 Tax=Priestia megaterium TaxID=1404 RepID=UPI00387A72A0